MTNRNGEIMKKFIVVFICVLFVATPSFSDRGGDRRRGGGYFYPYYYGYGSYQRVYDPYWNYNYYYNSGYYAQKAQAAREEINRLEESKASAAKANSALTALKIEKARFYKQYFTDRASESMAEIRIVNTSQYDGISKIYFRGDIKTYMTGKQLINDSFDYVLPAPLNSGERATYKIPLNAFGSWAKFQTPPDTAIFTVSVEGVDINDGTSLRGDAFSARDQKRLNQLKKNYVY